MVITYYGLQFFKIQLGDLVIALNPISKQSQPKPPRFGADIVLVTLNHPDFNGVENLSHGDRQPFVISGPGEYEIKQVFVKGYLTKTHYGGEESINTVYYLILDGVDMCFVGALDTPLISNDILEDIGNIDILFVPIGGGGVLMPAGAHKTSLSLQPKTIIPMHYDTPMLKKFLDEAGVEKVEPIEKLTIKKKGLEGKEGEIMVLKPLI